jgi:hypothetical protein
VLFLLGCKGLKKFGVLIGRIFSFSDVGIFFFCQKRNPHEVEKGKCSIENVFELEGLGCTIFFGKGRIFLFQPGEQSSMRILSWHSGNLEWI